jgi:hypothetical protein
MQAATADSGLVRVAALYTIKNEPGQEATAANSRDAEQQHAANDSDLAVADLAALALPAGAIAAAAAAQQRASAVPNYARPVPGNDQARDDEVESSEEEDCEPVLKRRKKCATTSKFVGVSWHKRDRKWTARIRHGGKSQSLGEFRDELEAARAVDTVARRLRGKDAHGGRWPSGGRIWHRLNFPTEEEVKRAQERGALLTEEDKAAAAAASGRQGPSQFVGVSWRKKDRKWVARIAHAQVKTSSCFIGVSWEKSKRKWAAQIRHGGKHQHLGRFDDEQEAARAADAAARRLRGEDAHGGRAGTNWLRLNFPSKQEAGQAKALGMPAARYRRPSEAKRR